MILCFLIVCPLVMGLCALREVTGRGAWGTALLASLIQMLSAVALLLRGSAPLRIPLFSDFGISLSETPLGLLFVALSALLWFVAVVAGRTYFQEDFHLQRFYGSLLITLSGLTGVFLAADLFTLFIFFEVMSFTSYLWVAHDQTDTALSAGVSYLAFGVMGGLSLLFGIFLLYGICPDLTISNLATNFAPFIGATQLTLACCFLFIGFGAKAGAFFLHDWLPQSYTAAPAPATALLSGLLSKAGVYGILLIGTRILSGWEGFALFLLGISLLNMVVGGLCALCSANLKGTLAFSSISQIGFMLWGCALCSLLGEHGAIAAYGTIFHMVNHSLIKVLLFLLAGVAYASRHTLDLNQLRGFGKGKPLFHLLFLVGGLAVAGIPGLSGYISKTLLHEAMVEYIHLTEASGIFTVMEYLFLFAGGCTLAYLLKLYVCLCWEGDSSESTQWGDAALKLSLTVLGLSLVILGAVPHLTFDVLGANLVSFFGLHELETVSYFSRTNLSGSLVSISVGLLLFALQRVLSRGQYGELNRPENTLEYRIYRPAITIFSFVGSLGARIFDVALDLTVFVLSRTAFATLQIPDTFFYGDDHAIKIPRPRIHVTYSLAYSLLMFGMGFLVTIVALFVLGGRG